MQTRTLITIISAILGVAALTPAATARETSGCERFRPRAIENYYSADAAEAFEAPVLRVTDRHTAAKPLTLDYEQRENLWVQEPVFWSWTPVVQDTVFHNVQVISRLSTVGLYARIEWPTPSRSDIDLALYDGYGQNVYWSGAYNFPVVDAAGRLVWGPYSGGEGFEEIAGWPAARCDGFTLESWSMFTTGERITMKLWLGQVSDDF